MKDDLYLNGKSCIKIGMFPVKPPIIPTAKKQYKEHTIPGRDGIYYEDLGTYDDITLPVQFNFMSKDKSVDQRFRYYRRILSMAKEFRRESDPDMFYKIKKIEIGDLDRGTSETIGTFQCDFTFDPYAYLMAGTKKMTVKSVEYNEYDLCHPIYILIGEGNCILNVNGKTASCNVSGTVYIDTDLRLCYREDNSWVNTSLTGDYEDLYFNHGKNIITHSDGFDIRIIPNWRTAV